MRVLASSWQEGMRRPNVRWLHVLCALLTCKLLVEDDAEELLREPLDLVGPPVDVVREEGAQHLQETGTVSVRAQSPYTDAGQAKS